MNKAINKRFIFTQGGKGGVGKTTAISALVGWYQDKKVKIDLLDFDAENTQKSGLQNFHPEAKKFDYQKKNSFDEFFNYMEGDEPKVILADIGAGAGKVTYDWFEKAYDFASQYVQFTSIGVITPDPASIASVLKWAKHLQKKCEYLIVLNELTSNQQTFSYWEEQEDVQKFKQIFKPKVAMMQERDAEFEAHMRNHCLTLDKIINRDHEIEELRHLKYIGQATRYRDELWKGFDQASKILLP